MTVFLKVFGDGSDTIPVMTVFWNGSCYYWVTVFAGHPFYGVLVRRAGLQSTSAEKVRDTKDG